MTKNEIDFTLTDTPNIFQYVKVINKVNFGSDLRMRVGNIKINTREIFQLDNQFRLLHEEHKEIDTNQDERNEQIVEDILKTASEITGKKKKTHSDTISDSTRKLIEKKGQMKNGQPRRPKYGIHRNM